MLFRSEGAARDHEQRQHEAKPKAAARARPLFGWGRASACAPRLAVGRALALAFALGFASTLAFAATRALERVGEAAVGHKAGARVPEVGARARAGGERGSATAACVGGALLPCRHGGRGRTVMAGQLRGGNAQELACLGASCTSTAVPGWLAGPASATRALREGRRRRAGRKNAPPNHRVKNPTRGGNHVKRNRLRRGSGGQREERGGGGGGERARKNRGAKRLGGVEA